MSDRYVPRPEDWDLCEGGRCCAQAQAIMDSLHQRLNLVKTEAEIRAELERLDNYKRGSYEELAGAAAALRWVLGEEPFTVVDWSAA